MFLWEDKPGMEILLQDFPHWAQSQILRMKGSNYNECIIATNFTHLRSMGYLSKSN